MPRKINDEPMALPRNPSAQESWLAANRDALLEMAAWDRVSDIFGPPLFEFSEADMPSETKRISQS